ncbi:MAG: hypothetical protein GY679_01705 [Mycoplasma sp.]|nr:hypothetical protein [Mycoplasma sp.]
MDIKLRDLPSCLECKYDMIDVDTRKHYCLICRKNRKLKDADKTKILVDVPSNCPFSKYHQDGLMREFKENLPELLEIIQDCKNKLKVNKK